MLEIAWGFHACDYLTPTIVPELVTDPVRPIILIHPTGIWGNKISIFIGVHCHYANLTLR